MASTIRRSAQTVNEMGIQIWTRDAAALLWGARNSKQNDFAGSIVRRLHGLSAETHAIVRTGLLPSQFAAAAFTFSKKRPFPPLMSEISITVPG